ncbi:GNAT family N-acetyltransferase [Ruegeria aquimaris]|uniref:GNAT family N-acetyltransferase n=1 Tax=Ruegeria aquimaris TaxID=2984333 RepID=A0ABT3ARU3_9RHOB|nr:GNAT family N-acetyltransferase [Ruegeria sp. XHP0148]MCV2891378.1 GNAT family N-acetyltransferase [Ruegeria sp. XHP0148]
MDSVTLRPFRADDTLWLVERHGTLYAEAEGFDDSFAPLVAEILGAFIADHDPTCERGWIAEEAGQRLGSIFCVRLDETTAKLRLFLLVPEARGRGLGRRLLDTCMGFARDKGYTQMQLWTHESHRAACALYAATGWQLTDSKPVHSFGVDLVEQTWKITL